MSTLIGSLRSRVSLQRAATSPTDTAPKRLSLSKRRAPSRRRRISSLPKVVFARLNR